MPFPRIVRVRQEFPRPRVGDVERAVREQCARKEIARSLQPGMSVAITAGSRGIANIAAVLRSLIRSVRGAGASPLIVPAMGSHGGATAEGQVEVLRSLGVTEEFVGAPIRSSMEVVQLGETESGVPVYMDRIAYDSDGVIIAGRVKRHTDFRADIESGLLKMAAIGLGKHRGPWRCTRWALEVSGITWSRWGVEFSPPGRFSSDSESSRTRTRYTAAIEAVAPARVVEREAALLRESARLMPGLPVSEIDVLFVDELGKNFSGTGMDTNIVGRFRIPGVEEPVKPSVKYLIVSSVSEASHGNALGVGLADLTTERLFNRIGYGAINQNVLTSTFLERAKIPMVIKNDREALQAAIRCNWGVALEDTRFVRIPNTLHLRHLDLSENLLEEALAGGNAEVVGEASEMSFGEDGYFVLYGAEQQTSVAGLEGG